MINFSSLVPFHRTYKIDFKRSYVNGVVSDDSRILGSRKMGIEILLKAMNSHHVKLCTSSEREVLRNFFRWFADCKRGFGIQKYSEFASKMPANTTFVYVNLNTGVVVVLIAYVDEGCNETHGLMSDI